MHFSRKTWAITTLLLAAFSLSACAGDIDPLSLLPEDTSVLVKIDFEKLTGADIFTDLNIELLGKVPGYTQFTRLLEKAQCTPLEPDSDKPAGYVKEAYLAKARINESEDDVVALLIGKAELRYTITILKKELPDAVVKTPEETGAKYYSIKGLFHKDETLFMVQLEGAIGVARTGKAALEFLGREAQTEGARGIRKNEAFNALANKLIPVESTFDRSPLITAIVLIDADSRKMFARGDDVDTKLFQYVKFAWLKIDSGANGFNIQARCECTGEEDAGSIEIALKMFFLRAMLTAENPPMRDVFRKVGKSVKTIITGNEDERKAFVDISPDLSYPDSVDIIKEIKLLALGADKPEETHPHEPGPGLETQPDTGK